MVELQAHSGVVFAKTVALKLNTNGLAKISLLYNANLALFSPVMVGANEMPNVVESFGAIAATEIGMLILYCVNEAVNNCTKFMDDKSASPVFLMVNICCAD